MERYSGIQAMEGVPVDPAAEWAAPGGETGLEERMWQLGLGAGPKAYPLGPDEPDCIYFMRTGFCGYGNRCRFNHPRHRNSVMGSLRTSIGEYPERTGQPVCQYYMRTRMCKFGSTCKYHHPNYGVGSSAPITLNFYGYPSIPGEKECSHYMKTGQCRFGITCKFHHPQPTGIQLPIHGPGLAAPPGGPTAAVYPTVQSPSLQTSQYGLISGNWPVDRSAIIPGSYVHGSYGPMVLPPGVIPVPGWGPYPAPVHPGISPSIQPTVGAGPIYGITQVSPSLASYTGPYIPITSSIGQSSSTHKEHEFPERPGEPECQYFLRTGDCKFGSTCKYHHAREWIAPKVNFCPMGLPLHPGMPICYHYAQSGMCRYGPSCRFDHPTGTMSYSPSSSSLTDMPVAPYPVRSTTATLAPSSSSLDLRPKNLSGPTQDSGPSQMSDANSSSTLVGPIILEGWPTPQSGARHSRPGSASPR